MAVSSENGLNEVKENVEQKFSEIRSALYMREKLLLRQLDVIANSQQMAGRGATVPKSPTEDSKEGAEVKFVAEQDTELLAAIRCFGRFQLDNMNLAMQDVYLKNEDYIEPADDHETMYKCLQEPKDDIECVVDDSQPEAIVVDFSRNKSLVEDNAKLMNKSIINITLQEAKELIHKAKAKRDTYVPPLNLEELDDELESSIADAVSNLGRETTKSSSSHTCVPSEPNIGKPKTKKPRFKPKITINNCNGTINLRNIASLTINCANEEAVSAEIPLAKVQSADSSTTEHSTSSTTTASSSNYSSNASSRSQSKKMKGGKKSKSTKQDAAQCKTHNAGATKAPEATTTTEEEEAESLQPTSTDTNSYRYANEDNDDCNDPHIVTCDFYNRLLNEIKKSLKEKPIRNYETAFVQAAAADSTCDANNASASTSLCTTSATGNTNSTNATHIQPGKRLILKNFENLKIILEANSGDEDTFHPVQIEQWLAEIISETDQEPMQNTDILEHSKINSESN